MSRRLAGSSSCCTRWQQRWLKMCRQRRHERGISLIETLVAMALGLLVLAGVLQLTNQLIDGNTATIKVARLEQDTRTVLDIIIQDLRRAGNFPEAARDLGDVHRFLQDQPTAPLIDGDPLQTGKAGSSIIYAYRENDGKLTQAKFSLDAKAGTVQMHTGTASAAETITDSNFMTVIGLVFTPTLVSQKSGTLNNQSVVIEVRLNTRLKSDPAVERQLIDRVVLRNAVLVASQ